MNCLMGECVRGGKPPGGSSGLGLYRMEKGLSGLLPGEGLMGRWESRVSSQILASGVGETAQGWEQQKMTEIKTPSASALSPPTETDTSPHLLPGFPPQGESWPEARAPDTYFSSSLSRAPSGPEGL